MCESLVCFAAEQICNFKSWKEQHASKPTKWGLFIEVNGRNLGICLSEKQLLSCLSNTLGVTSGGSVVLH